MKIRQTDTDLGLAAHWVRRARHFIEGEDAVKKRGLLYLPKSSADQPTASYKSMREHTIFYPATSRTLEGLAGLIFRKPPVVEGAPDGSIMARLLASITGAGDDILTFSYNAVCESLTSNFYALLVDMPRGEVDANISAEERVAQDKRPFVGLYSFENIIAREYETRGGIKTLVYARLRDEDQSERELRLIEGEYWVQVSKNIDGRLVEQAPFQPLRNDMPLKHIPLFINTKITNGVIEESPISRVANLNLSHFRNEGLIAMSKLFQASPQGYIFGVDWPEDPATKKPFKPTVSPGTFWTNPTGEHVQIGYLEYSGEGLKDMRADREHIEQLMAITGARIIAGEKIAAEAPETLAIRRASENSALAAIANLNSKAIQDALNEVGDWMGLPHVKFQLNTDFLPQPLTAAEIQAHVAMLQAGILSGETVFLALRDGDVVNPTLTWDTEMKRLQADKAAGLNFTVDKSSPTLKPVPAELPRDDTAAPLA